MSRFQLRRERTTRSVVFEGEVVRLLEQCAAVRQRSLSSVVREAVAGSSKTRTGHRDGLEIVPRGFERGARESNGKKVRRSR